MYFHKLRIHRLFLLKLKIMVDQMIYIIKTFRLLFLV